MKFIGADDFKLKTNEQKFIFRIAPIQILNYFERFKCLIKSEFEDRGGKSYLSTQINFNGHIFNVFLS